jgi:hypothetical protein
VIKTSTERPREKPSPDTTGVPVESAAWFPERGGNRACSARAAKRAIQGFSRFAAALPRLTLAFLGVELFDGFATTTDNVRGLPPDLLGLAGFENAEN